MNDTKLDPPRPTGPIQDNSDELAGLGIGFGLVVVAEVLIFLLAVSGSQHSGSSIWGPLQVMALVAAVIAASVASSGKFKLALGIAAGYFLVTPLFFTEGSLVFGMVDKYHLSMRKRITELHGTVTDQSGLPLAGAPLWIVLQDNLPPLLLHSGEDGRFAADIPKGTSAYQVIPLGFVAMDGGIYDPDGEGGGNSIFVSSSQQSFTDSKFPGGNFDSSDPRSVPVRMIRNAGVRRMIDFTRPVRGDQQGDAQYGLRVAEGILHPGKCRDCDLMIRITGCKLSCPEGKNATNDQRPWSVEVTAGKSGGVLAQTANGTANSNSVPEQGLEPGATLQQTGCNDIHAYRHNTDSPTAPRNLIYFRTAGDQVYGRLEFTLRCPATFPGVMEYELGELRVVANPRGDPNLKERGAGVIVDPLDLPVKLPYRDEWKADFNRISVKKINEGWRVSGVAGAATGARRVTLIRERPPEGKGISPAAVSEWTSVAADGSFMLTAGGAADDRPYLAIEYPWPQGCRRPSCNLDLIPLGLVLQKHAASAAAPPQSAPVIATGVK